MSNKLNSVLFIDDDMMSNLNSKRIIEKAIEVNEILLAESGLEALDLLKKKFIPAGKFPELIFLDIYMPHLNGWEMLGLFKELGLPAKTKIILLSASDDDDDRHRASKIPEVAGYKIKPLTEEYILDLIHNLSA